MEHTMFCFQCEQTAGCTGCTGKAGACGKSAGTAKLQDELTGALRGECLLLYAGMIVGANLVLALLSSAVKRGLDEKELYVNNMMDRVMAEKVMKVPFGCLETPEYLDLKERALFAFNNQSAPFEMIRSTAQFLQSALIIITTLAVMLTLSPVLVLSLIHI